MEDSTTNSDVAPQAESEPPSEGESLDAIVDAVDAVRGDLPYPDSVIDCVVGRAAGDRKIVDLAVSESVSVDDLLPHAAACAVAVEAGPLFVDGLRDLTDEGLTDEQAACAERAYGRLSAEELQSLSGVVLNPEAASPGAIEVWDGLIDECGISLKGGD